MAKQRLSEAKIKAARGRGLYGDGGGLYLQVTERGHRSWVYRFRLRKRLRTMGLGSLATVSLKDARVAHAEAKALRDAGVDPIAARGTARHVAAAALSVEDSCEKYVEAQRAKWKTAKHVEQIEQRLRDYVYPVIGHLPIAEIKAAEVRQVLAPIWKTKNPTAGRVRQYMEDVTNWSIHEGVRADESNPWEIKRIKFAFPLGIHKVTNHPALPFEQAPAFLAELRTVGGTKARALEFIMLTAVRVADVTGGGKAHSEAMKWSHLDLPGALWTIPVTKTGKSLSVPLAEPALHLLGEMVRHRDPTSDFVFPGSRAGTVLHSATLRHMLKAIGYGGTMTVHGARALFRTWASEVTSFEKDTIEACLGHSRSALDQAYHRGSFLAKRRRLMAQWAAYLECDVARPEEKVVALR